MSCVCGRSSSGRARPCQGRGSEFEPRRPLQKQNTTRQGGVFVFGMTAGRGSNRARAKREKQSGGLFWCPRACRGTAVPSGEPRRPLQKRNPHPFGWGFLFWSYSLHSKLPAYGGFYFTGEGWTLSPLTHPPVSNRARNPLLWTVYCPLHPIQKDGVFCFYGHLSSTMVY